MATHKLIGAPISYYTGKVRAYLRFKQIPHEEILSSGEVYQNTIMPRVGFPVIPVFITDEDQTLQDSTDIIDYLETKYPNQPVYPSTPLQKFVALLMEVYGDEWLLLPAMHYRWNLPENREYAIRKFGETSAPEATPDEQLKIGQDRSDRFAGSLPILGVTEETKAAIETSYLQLLSDFEAHLKHHPFLLGTRPSIGDYGLIGPLYAHLYLDPASGRIMEQHAPGVVDWVKRMHDPKTHEGEFLPDDQIPETLLPLLARMFTEHVPVLLSTIRHIKKWSDENPGETKVPRNIGSHSFVVEGVEGVRAILPANQWMWQRPYDLYHSVDDNSRNKINNYLSSFPGAVEAMNSTISSRLARDNFRFRLEA